MYQVYKQHYSTNAVDKLKWTRDEIERLKGEQEGRRMIKRN